MSGATTAVVVGAAIGAGTAMYMGDKQASAQKESQKQAQQSALVQQQQQEMLAAHQAAQARDESERLIQEYQNQTTAYNDQTAVMSQQLQQQTKAHSEQLSLMQQEANRVSQKRPGTQSALAAVGAASRAGQSGTMLTGPQGVDPSTMSLGRATLLGQ